MIYKIDCQFYECQATYYASSFHEAYEMFKKLGNKLKRTGFLIRGKMYEKKEGNIRKGVYYTGINEVAQSPSITMSPTTETEVKISTVAEAFGDLHWKIFNKEISECVPGLNDLKFHYGK